MKKFFIYLILLLYLAFPAMLVYTFVNYWYNPPTPGLTDHENDPAVQAALRQLRHGIKDSDIHPDLKKEKGFERIIPVINAGLKDINRYKLAGYNRTTFASEGKSTTTHSIIFEGKGEGEQYYQVDAVLAEDKPGVFLFKGVHFKLLEGSILENSTLRTEWNNTHLGLAILLLAILGSIYYAGYQIAFVVKPRRQILWLIASMFSLGQFIFHWKAGTFAFNPMGFNLFGFGFSKSSLVGDWKFVFGIPVFALLFIVKYKIRRSDSAPERDTPL